ncbi:hypothetical protein MFIFM68171_10121 [Madurella fahalii]|uniref:Protein kinase domain-containing protein n=1 Tax=Madurella fahalii TaxID=1157608 RepID=A0ABQ0GQ90_9PEZI
MDTRKYQPLPEPLLGKGGYGKVFKVRQRAEKKSDEKILACKVIPSGSDSASETIKNEYERVSKLDHPNIVRVVEFLSRSKFSLIFMEFCEEGDLKTFINGRRRLQEPLLPEYLVLDIAIQLADALDYCHNQVPGILHKDVKPENGTNIVLLLAGYHVKLCDFGLIAVTESGGIVKGSRTSTLRYMAPMKSEEDLPIGLPDDYFSSELNNLVMECMAINDKDRPDTANVLARTRNLRIQAVATNEETDQERNGIMTQSNAAVPVQIGDDANPETNGVMEHTDGDTVVDQMQNALHWAAATGDAKSIEMTKLLLSILEDVNISSFVNEPDGEGRTPLWWAIENGRTEMAELLLDNKARFDTDGLGGVAALIKAVSNGYNGTVERLLTLPDPINVNGVDDHGKSALHMAAVRGNVKIARLLLDRGADINAQDANGRTALHEAGGPDFHNWEEMMELLLGYGARIDAGDDEGKTVLHIMSLRKASDALEFLLKKGADLNAVDDEGRTPLHVAAVTGYAPAVSILLWAKANPDAQDNTYRTPLHLAIDEAFPDATLRVVELLLKSAADVNIKDANGLTVLQKAADRGLEPVVARLLRVEHLSIKKEDQKKPTTLHIAASRGLRDIVPLLVEAGASITSTNEKGQTPLHEALKRASRLTKANRRYNNWISVLIGDSDSGVLGIQDEDGNTPLHMAVLHKAKPDLVQLLVDRFQEATCIRNKKGLVPYQCLEPPSDAQPRGDIRAKEGPRLLQKAGIERDSISINRKDTGGARSSVKEDDAEIIRDMLRYHYVRNMPPGGGQRGSFYTESQERRISFDLTGMTKPITLELLKPLERQMTFEPILKYVHLPSEALQVDKESATHGSEKPPAMIVFNWLREKKGVRRILEVSVVDMGETPYRDETIEGTLGSDLNIEVWDWQKIDISSDTIVKVAPNAQVVRLYCSGNTSILHAWSGKHGLARLRNLKKLELSVDPDAGGAGRAMDTRRSLDSYKKDFTTRLLRRLPNVEVTYKPFPSRMPRDVRAHPTDLKSHGWLRAMENFQRLAEGWTQALTKMFANDPHPSWLAHPLKMAHVKIAVIGDGADLTDAELTRDGHGSIVDGKSFVGPYHNANRIEEYFVCASGYGTLTTRLIRRICPPADLYIAKLPRKPGSLGPVAEAVEWAIKKRVDIICMSWIMQYADTNGEFEAAIKRANADGIAILCLADEPGTTDQSADDMGIDYYDSNYYDSVEPDGNARMYPACLGEPIRIGAVRPGKGLESFRNHPKLDYTFPGDKMLSEVLGGTGFPGTLMAVAMAVGLAGLTIFGHRALRSLADFSASQPTVNWDLAIRRAFDVYAKDWRRLLSPDALSLRGKAPELLGLLYSLFDADISHK